MNIETAAKVLYAASLADDTVIMEGPHGIGKSEVVVQFAETDDYHLEVLFLSNQEVGDLIGLPETVVDEDGISLTTWTVPIWLQRMRRAAAQGKKCILFLDELNRAPIDVRQSALQLVLERRIHEHELPKVGGFRTMVVAAINPADEYQVDELDPALLDRFLHITVEADAPSWLKYARKKGLTTVTRDFISEFPDRLHWTPADGGIGATPRSWVKLDAHLQNADLIEPDILFHVMKGKVGKEIAAQFFSFFKNYVNVVKMDDVIKLIDENKDDVEHIEDLTECLRDLMSKAEAIQKTEMLQQLVAHGFENKNMFYLLAYLYSLDTEICVAGLKGLRKDNEKAYKMLVDLDDKLTEKELFKRIVVASDKK